MAGIGTIVNVVLIIAGSAVGLLLKKAIPEKLKNSIVQALALATFTIGMIGTVTASCSVLKQGGKIVSSFTLMMVLSMAIGTFVGEVIGIEKQLDNFGNKLQKRFSSGGSTFGEGFVTASLVFCVGSMAILGALNDGISHDPTVLITKSILDGIMSVVFASTLGIGVVFSIFSVGIYQGLITACASLLSPLLTETVIAQMSFVGSILIMGIGLNFIYKPKLKLANMLPSMFIPLIWYIITGLAGRFI